ncbi:MAG: ADP-ribosylglycohydrolase family protein [Rhodospirillales bacterium]|nr:MAG: ADP-ribosylglycohydrolase family protein [Rhodospirillales bacterium]
MFPSENQVAGCLIGQCVGDAVGFVVEGAAASVCRPYADAVLLRGEIPGTRRGGFPFGQFSDDSQLARELVLSLMAYQPFDPADYGARIRDLFTTGRIVGGGRATAEAAARLASGVPWNESGTPPPNAGNGSAMRAGPVGLVCFNDPDRLIGLACDQGRITHADPRCSAGAVAVAGAVALAMTEGPLDVPAVAATLATWANRVDRRVGDAIAELPGIVAMSPADALPAIQAIVAADFDDGEAAGGVSPFVTTSVLWSLYAFLRTPDTYRQCLHTAVAVGGDVDTTAAMAGAMAGARVGLDGIPRPLAERIEDRGEWRLDRWRDLAGRLWRRCVAPVTGAQLRD